MACLSERSTPVFWRRNASHVVSLAFVLVFFGFGRWQFFELLDIKLLVQVIALMIIFLFVFGVVLIRGRVKLSNAELIVFVALLFCAAGDLYRGELLGSVEVLVSLVCLVALTQLQLHQLYRCASLLVTASSIFALSATIVTLLVAVDLINPKAVYLNYNFPVNSIENKDIGMPVALFGLVTPYDSFEYFGFRIYRLMSLSSEPARLSIYFGIPFLISLAMRNRYKSSIILLVAMGFTNSLSVLAPIIFGSITLIFHRLLSVRYKFYLISSAAMILAFYFVVIFYGDALVNEIINERVRAQVEGYGHVVRGSTPVKFESINSLLGISLNYFPWPSQVPLPNGPLLFYVFGMGSITAFALAFSVPYILIKTNVFLTMSVRLQLVWICLLMHWGLAMVFTTAPFYLTPSGVIGLGILSRILLTKSAQHQYILDCHEKSN